MRERPILFSAPMVRAILEGRKTMTRRVVKLRHGADVVVTNGQVWKPARVDYAGYVDCPYGQVGDRLWVRETWNWFDPDEIPEVRRGRRAPFTGQQGARKIPWVAAYAADGHLEHEHLGLALWRPSVHMPRWASRITLEITAVRVELLQHISDNDIEAEGTVQWVKDGGVVRSPHPGFDGWWPDEDGNLYVKPNRVAFCSMWESVNGRLAWDENPWVWVIEFMRVE